MINKFGIVYLDGTPPEPPTRIVAPYYFLGREAFKGLAAIRDALNKDAMDRYNQEHHATYSGNSVPLDEDKHHWHPRLVEVPMDIMTSYFSFGQNYITPITRGALVDLGYSVDMNVEIKKTGVGGAIQVLGQYGSGKPTINRPTFICIIKDHL